METTQIVEAVENAVSDLSLSPSAIATAVLFIAFVLIFVMIGNRLLHLHKAEKLMTKMSKQAKQGSVEMFLVEIDTELARAGLGWSALGVSDLRINQMLLEGYLNQIQKLSALPASFETKRLIEVFSAKADWLRARIKLEQTVTVQVTRPLVLAKGFDSKTRFVA